MSTLSSPYPSSGYASPFTPPISKPSSHRSTPKPVNVFTNDGSFLERVQRSKREEEENRAEQQALEMKKSFDDRFRNRGKRRAPTASPYADSSTSSQSPEPHLAKRAKPDEASKTDSKGKPETLHRKPAKV